MKVLLPPGWPRPKGFAARLMRIVQVPSLGLAVVSMNGERTIDELLSDVEFQMTWENCVVEVEYDPTFGYPQKVYVDCGQEGEGWTITRFEDR